MHSAGLATTVSTWAVWGRFFVIGYKVLRLKNHCRGPPTGLLRVAAQGREDAASGDRGGTERLEGLTLIYASRLAASSCEALINLD